MEDKEVKFYEVSKDNAPVGFSCLRFITSDPIYTVALLFSNYISCLFVLYDFAKVISKMDQNKRSSIETLSEPTLFMLIYSMDNVFLVKTIIEYVDRRSIWKHGNKALLLDIISLLPVELVYVLVNGEHIMIFYVLRLRYLLRLVRYVFDMCVRKFRKSSVFSMITMFLLITTMFSMVAINAQYQIICNDERGCKELTLQLFSYEYFIMLSQVTSIGLNVKNTSWDNRNTIINVLSSSCMFVFVNFASWKIVCCGMKQLTYKHQLALDCDIAMWEVKLAVLPRSKSAQHVHLDKLYMKYLKNCLNLYWLGINFMNPEKAEVKGFITGNLPQIIYTEIMLDLSWNLFQHSVLFRNEEKYVLRKIAQFAIYRIFMAGEPIYIRGNFKSYMVYLVAGVIRVTSAINGETALIYLAPGTCLGEISLFYQSPAVTTVICETHCEIVMINCQDMLNLKKTYPSAYHDLKFRILNRISDAKIYNYIRKRDLKFDPSMRYVKRVLRREEKPKFFFSNVKYDEEAYLNKTVFCAEYLSMYMINDDYREAENIVKTGFFFKIHPNSAILLSWNFMLHCLTSSLCVVYPISAVYVSEELDYIYECYMNLITVFFIIDFCSVYFIAVVDKDGIHKNFDYICNVKVFNWDYFFDMISAIPLEQIAEVLNTTLNPHAHRFLQANRLFKVRNLLKALNDRHFFNTSELFRQFFCKCLMYFIIMILVGFYIVVYYDYVKYTEIGKIDSFYNMFLSLCFVFQTYFSASIMVFNLENTVDPINFFPLVFLQYVAFYWKIITISEIVGNYSLVYATNIKYKNFIDDNKAVLSLYEYNAQDKKKIFDVLHMHYNIRRGLYLSDTDSIRQLIGDSLFKYQRSLLFEEFFLAEKLFHLMDRKILKDIIDIGTIVLIPRGQFIEYAGAIAKDIYLILKGNCGYLNKKSKLKHTLKPSDSLFVLEFVLKSKVMHNVIALTDCKLLALSTVLIRRKLVEHPSEYFMLKEIAEQMKFKRRTIEEIDLNTLTVQKENVKSFYQFKDKYHIFIQGFGKFNIMSMLFLKYTITPNGKFWFYWEISRLVFAYLGAFLGCLPFADYKNLYSPYFYIFRLLDITAIADIILRHYVVFYNDLDIEVTHPWKTACHYWRTSLFIDFIAMLPLDLFLMNNPKYIIIDTVWPRFNRLLQLYRVIGFQKFCTVSKMDDILFISIIIYVLIILLFFNIAFSTLFYGYCDYNIVTHLIICEESVYKDWQTYFYTMYKYLKNIFSIGFSNNIYQPGQTWKHCLCCMCGIIYTISFTCIVTSMKLFSNGLLTAYQIRMQRMVTFFNLRRIDKRVSNEIIKHFEHLWLLREGREIEDAFSKFNKCCYEEMVYSQYGQNLKDSILFHGFPRAVLKELLGGVHVSREFILITGIIINVNDVRNNIYIIFKGEVDVFGPDLKFVTNLSVGSAFGCLDNVKNNRSTLLYVAKTHCELIVIPSKIFYVICLQFPDFHENYMRLLRMTNCDYIKSFGNISGVSKTSSTRIARAEAKHKYFWLTFICRKLFAVKRRHKQLDLYMTFFYLIGFIFECYQKCNMKISNFVLVTCYSLDAIHYYKMYLFFLTSYENDYGLLVTNRKLIALRYVNNYSIFLVDFFSSFPFEIIAMAFYYRDVFPEIWSIGRSNRILRILYVFRYINSMRNKLNVNVTFATLAKVVLYLLTLQQLTTMFIAHDEVVHSICEDDDACLYKTALYIQFFYMAGISTEPFRTKSAMKYLTYIKYSLPYSLILLATNLTMLFVFAEGVSSFQIMYYSRYKYESFVEMFNKRMTYKGVSLPLKKRINTYLQNLFNADRIVQFPSFIVISPIYLREAVLNTMFGYHLRRHPAFKKCHKDLVRQIASTFRTIYFFKEDFLIHKGDINNEMYFIHCGEIYGLSEDSLDREVAERVLKAGDSIGYEQLFLKNVGHKYSYKVTAETVILILTTNDIMPLLDFFPASKHTLFNFE